MTTALEENTRPGSVPAHQYPAHVDRVLSNRGRPAPTDRAPTKPKFGHSFASEQYRRDHGLTVAGRYDWLLLVAALAVCGLVLAGLAVAFH